MRASELGYKTLVMSCDTAHSLSDGFNIQLSNKPTKIKENLYGQEIDIQKEMEENWYMASEYLSAFLSARGMSDIAAEELAIIPGLEELFSLMEIKEHISSRKYDVIIVDSAPSASSLRLLSFPDTLSWYVRNIFNISRTAKKVGKMFSRKKTSSDKSIIGMIENVYERIDGLHDILTDKYQTSVRLVVNPEKIVIKEAQRLWTYFNLFGIHTDAVMVNKILPDELSDEFFTGWKQIQKQHLQLIKEVFEPLPIYKIRLFGEEVVGEKLLYKLVENIYGKDDPVKVLYDDKIIEFIKDKEGTVVKIKVPYIEKEKIDLLQRGNELIIRIGSFKHGIVLPSSLAGQIPKSAKIQDRNLFVYFGEK